MVKLQKGLNINVEGGAGHGEVEGGDDIGVKHPKASDAFSAKKDFSAAAREEGGVWAREVNIISLYHSFHNNII